MQLKLTLNSKISDWNELSVVLDHAILERQVITTTEGVVKFFLRRLPDGVKPNTRLLPRIVCVDPKRMIPCLLTIRQVKHVSAPTDQSPNEIILGGISFSGTNEIYIGAFCEQESDYGVTIKIDQIDVELRDIVSKID